MNTVGLQNKATFRYLTLLQYEVIDLIIITFKATVTRPAISSLLSIQNLYPSRKNLEINNKIGKKISLH